MTSETYDLLADLLSYPSNETRNALDRCRTQLRSDAPDAVASLDRFAEQTSSMSTEELQELYTQSFDLNPTCSLEVGWQLYGENYSRGELLVEMRKTLRRLGVAETTELPDHLTLVLAALGRMDAEEAGRFAPKSYSGTDQDAAGPERQAEPVCQRARSDSIDSKRGCATGSLPGARAT